MIVIFVIILTLFSLLTIASVTALILTRKQSHYSPKEHHTNSTERAKNDVKNYIDSNEFTNNDL